MKTKRKSHQVVAQSQPGLFSSRGEKKTRKNKNEQHANSNSKGLRHHFHSYSKSRELMHHFHSYSKSKEGLMHHFHTNPKSKGLMHHFRSHSKSRGLMNHFHTYPTSMGLMRHFHTNPKSRGLMHLADWVPTLLGLAGVEPPPGEISFYFFIEFFLRISLVWHHHQWQHQIFRSVPNPLHTEVHGQREPIEAIIIIPIVLIIINFIIKRSSHEITETERTTAMARMEKSLVLLVVLVV